MMTLHDYLSANTLISNTRDIFDYDTFAQRFRVRYGARNIRTDVPIDVIPAYAQNVVDVNADFYSAVFAHVLDPYKTWGENGSGNNKTVTDNNATETTDYSTITAGNNTTNSGGDSTTTTDSTTANNNFHNAYNAPTTPAPTDNSTGTAKDTTVNNYGDTVKTTTDNTVTNNGTKTNTSGGTTTNTNDTQRTGWTNSDALATIHDYTAAYDILIDDIAAVIIDMFIDLWG